MMSDEVLDRAKNSLRGDTRKEFLKAICPEVRHFDFSDGQKLVIRMPKHIAHGSKKEGVFLKYVPYSHRVIRDVLRALGLNPYKVGNDKEFITICSSKELS